MSADARPAEGAPEVADSQGMNYLVSLPRRVITVYVPIIAFLIVLLFPFYWMAITGFKPNEELLSREGNPFWVKNPTLAHVKKLLFDTAYPDWLWNTILVTVVATFISIFASVLAAYAIERLRFRGSRYVGMSIFLAYLVPPSILFIPLAAVVYRLQLFDTRLALILTYPTFLIPFCTWLLMGYLRSIPFELEECALIDGASRLQILGKIILPLAVPGLISAGIFAFTLSWNEFIYALTFISSSEVKTVPIGVITELVEGDVYHSGPLIAGPQGARRSAQGGCLSGAAGRQDRDGDRHAFCDYHHRDGSRAWRPPGPACAEPQRGAQHRTGRWSRCGGGPGRRTQRRDTARIRARHPTGAVRIGSAGQDRRLFDHQWHDRPASRPDPAP